MAVSGNVGSIIQNFASKNYLDTNDFERMAIFADNFMHEKVKEAIEALHKFDDTGEYSDYCKVKMIFDDVTKYMNSRDSYITHNPNRNY